jgi:Raf kinase inhibitor-like YbhB/YbcL family protein
MRNRRPEARLQQGAETEPLPANPRSRTCARIRITGCAVRPTQNPGDIAHSHDVSIEPVTDLVNAVRHLYLRCCSAQMMHQRRRSARLDLRRGGGQNGLVVAFSSRTEQHTQHAIVLAILFVSAMTTSSGGQAMTFTLVSPAFAHQGEIPSRFTCDGADVSPPLRWSGVPGAAKSLMLIVDDPDAPDPAAPQMTWVHWLLYNLPVTVDGLPEGVAASALPSGARAGRNDWKRSGYGGPCPPIGRHRYFFKLYALDIALPDLAEPSKARLEKAMRTHVLAEAVLVGTYRRK